MSKKSSYSVVLSILVATMVAGCGKQDSQAPDVGVDCLTVNGDRNNVVIPLWAMKLYATCDDVKKNIPLVQSYLDKYSNGPEFSCVIEKSVPNSINKVRESFTRSSALKEAQEWMDELVKLKKENNC